MLFVALFCDLRNLLKERKKEIFHEAKCAVISKCLVCRRQDFSLDRIKAPMGEAPKRGMRGGGHPLPAEGSRDEDVPPSWKISNSHISRTGPSFSSFFICSDNNTTCNFTEHNRPKQDNKAK